MSNTIYYLTKVATSFDKTITKTYYLANRCRDNVWTLYGGTYGPKRFTLKILAENSKEYYERCEKDCPSFADASVEYKIVTECPFDRTERKEEENEQTSIQK